MVNAASDVISGITTGSLSAAQVQQRQSMHVAICSASWARVRLMRCGACTVTSAASTSRPVAWQQGVHQPDSLAALVVAHDVLMHSAGEAWTFAAPVGVVGAGASGGYRTRLGRPDLATLMAGVAAEARQSETDTDAPAGAVTSMPGYRRRIDGGGYDPLRGVRFRRPRR